MRFLCASHLHLGRRIPGIPEHLNLDPSRTATAAVWDHLVDTAIAEDVDAVLLGGNVIDRENRRFEPLGPLERGLTSLERAGIPVIAVAGVGDAESLPRVARDLGADLITVLDDEGWDMLTIDEVTIAGRSSSGGHGRVSVEGVPDDAGLVLIPATLSDDHIPEGTIAPVTTGDLPAVPRLWLLSQGREPDLVDLDGTIVIEPGAAAPLDPAETGPHGAWLVDLADPASATLLALSPVQFADVDIDVSDASSLQDVENAIVRGLHETLARAVENDARGHLLCVPCAVHLTGTTGLHHEVPALVDDLASTLDIQHDGVVAAITSVEIDTQPDIDIDPLLGRPDPVGELARLLRSLDPDAGERTPAHDALVQKAITRLQAVHRARVFASVASDPEPGPDTARALLRRESWNVLDALIRQRGVE